MNNTDRHIPIRMCVICRQHFAREELLRFVTCKGASGNGFILDKKSIMPGRGYYVCKNDKCFEKFKFFRLRKKKFRG